MKCRKNVKNLSLQEKRDFARAINLLKSEPSVINPGGQNRFDDFARVHLDTMLAQSDWTHGDSAFFSWHREMLYQFELELDRMVPGVTIPYWDWTRHQTSTDLGFPFKHDFIGTDGNDAAADRVDREPGAPTPYPYEFDPENWEIVVKDDAGDSSRLSRAFGERLDAPNLPENDSVVTGVGTSFRQTLASTTYQQLRERSEEDHHNLVHRWVGGNMFQRSSPNDPVFMMHHAAIDRIWTIWQERNPRLPKYVNTSGAAGHALDNEMIFNFFGNPSPWAAVTQNVDVVDSHTMHGDGVWYETDLPEIFQEPSPTLNFGEVPEGLTQYRAAHFRVRTCRPLRFRITGLPDAVATNFDVTPLGVEYPVMPNADYTPVDVYVWFQFTATGPSPDANVIVTVDLLDDEGYYAANEGDFFQVAVYNLTLRATVAARENNAVVLVLDRSYSMSAMAGGGSTRSQLMKNAVGVFHALLAPNDEIGVASFDDLVDDLLPLTTQGAGLGNTLTGNGLDPRGNTAIGQGIQLGATMLASASHSNRSMLILTDGNQNVTPYIENLPSGTINSRTYAIGFGLPGDVSDAVLNQITQNTSGDLIITGQLTGFDDQFLLTKYFVQVLAGVTSANTILDPAGELTWGAEQKITFNVAKADLEIDVIGLSPLPGLVEFWLETPGGEKITPADVGGLANINFNTADNLAFFRALLPVLPGDPEKSHAGQWTAHLRLASRDEFKKLLSGTNVDFKIGFGNMEDDQIAALRKIVERGSLPYHLIVNTRSNLELRASLRQLSLEPGATLTLEADLREYGVAYRGVAEMRAEVTRPDGSRVDLTLTPDEPGRYSTQMIASAAGLYRARVLASGAATGGGHFTREKNMTASIFAGGDRPRFDPASDGGPGGNREFYCRLIDCLLHDDGVRRLLERIDIDADSLQKCLDIVCTRGASPHRADNRPDAVQSARVDIGLLTAMVRSALLAEDPGRILTTAVAPVAPKVSKAATISRAAEDLAEPFQMSAEAAGIVKKKAAKKVNPKKGK